MSKSTLFFCLSLLMAIALTIILIDAGGGWVILMFIIIMAIVAFVSVLLGEPF